MNHLSMSSSWARLFLLFCIAFCALYTQVNAGVDASLYVDTRGDASATGNVIAAGVASESWTNNSAYQYPGNEIPTFYLYLNGSAYTSLAFTISHLLGSVVEVQAYPSSTTLYRRDNDTFADYVPLVIKQVRCTNDDLARHLVTINFRPSIPSFDASSISFYRWCVPPTLNIGTTPSGVDIYSSNTTHNIPFSTDNNNVDATMYLWAGVHAPYYMDNNTVSYTLTASSNDTNLAVPDVSGGLNNNDTLAVGHVNFVTIYYTYGCQPNVTGNVTFSLVINTGYVQTVNLTWWKVCSAVNSTNPPPLNIFGCHETNRSGTCLVSSSSGVKENWAGILNDGYSYYQQPQKLAFTFNYVGTDNSPLDCKFGISDLEPNIARTLNQPGDLINLPLNQDRKVPLNPICYAEGPARFQVSVNCNTTQSGSPTNYTPIVFFYNFKCVKPLIDVSSKQDHNVPDLVRSSVPVNGTVLVPPEGGSAANPQLVLPYKSTTIYMWLPPSLLHPQNFSALYVTLTLVNQPAYITTNMDLSGIENDVLDGEKPELALSVPITFTCTQVTSGVVTFNLAYGWGDTTTFYIQTSCQDPLPSEGGGDGLSGAAIFFIVFFVLLFVFCVAGSLFNYYNRGKRGWPIIPGYETCQTCYDKALGPNRYTPQMDYERTFKSNGGGYGSYGTTSGDSYQSNL